MAAKGHRLPPFYIGVPFYVGEKLRLQCVTCYGSKGAQTSPLLHRGPLSRRGKSSFAVCHLLCQQGAPRLSPFYLGVPLLRRGKSVCSVPPVMAAKGHSSSPPPPPTPFIFIFYFFYVGIPFYVGEKLCRVSTIMPARGTKTSPLLRREKSAVCHLLCQQGTQTCSPFYVEFPLLRSGK